MRYVPYSEVLEAAEGVIRAYLTANRRTANGVYVVVNAQGGHTAAVTWSNGYVQIMLPTLPPEARLSLAEADEILGFLVHEMAHLTHTSLKEMAKAAAEGGPKLQALTNVVEDLRIESLEIGPGRRIPNAEALLSGVAEALCRKTAYSPKTGEAWEGDLFRDVLHALVFLGRRANGLAIPSADRMAATLASDPARAAIVTWALDNQPRGHDVEAARKHAAAILARIEKAQAQGQQQGQGQQQQGQGQGQGEGQGQGQGAGQEGQGPGEGQGAGQGQEGQQGQGQGQQGQGQSAGGGTVTKADRAAKAAANAHAEAGTFGGLVGAMADRLAKADPNAKAWTQSAPHERERMSTLAQCRRAKIDRAHDTGRVEATKSLAPKSAKLRDQIRRLMRSAEVSDVVRGEISGRMDSRALVGMATGSPRVYSRRHDTPGVETGVFLLVDCSSSMDEGGRDIVGRKTGPNRIEAARCLALHLGEAIEAAGASLTVGGFYSYDREPRTLGLIAIAKEARQRMAEAAPRIAGLGEQGGTHLAPCIMEAARILGRDTRLNRRIVIALTDGVDLWGPKGIQAAEAYAKRLGVEVLGVGVQHDVRQTFRRAVNVMDLKTLATRGLGGLVEILGEARQ